MSIRNLPGADIGARPGLKSDITAKAWNRWCPDIRASADGGDDATISILDPIGPDFWGDGVTAKRISAALRSIGGRPVTVNVNSPGGDYFEGLAIYNLLREHPAAVTVNVIGIAASAASIIAMAADEVRIARAGFLMIHNVWIMAAGDRHALREVADWLEPFDATAVDIYAARTGLGDKDLGQMLDAETWIGAQAALDQGFADALLTSDAAQIETDDGPAATLRAEKKFDLIARRSGLTNSASRELLRDLKGGKPGAAPTGSRDDAAMERELSALLETVKSI